MLAVSIGHTVSLNRIPGYLLQKGTDEIVWGQGKNNDNDCQLPTYNMYCPEHDGEECGHRVAGCAAVAIGQEIRIHSTSRKLIFGKERQ